MAAVTTGRHRSNPDEGDAYGRHSWTIAGGLSVAALLERAVRAGDAVRLAWRGADGNGLVQTGDDFPTALLPVIRDQPREATGNDEGTEPTTAAQETRRWLRPLGFSWWQQCLARI